MSELKRCPFCGNEKPYLFEFTGFFEIREYFVSCRFPSLFQEDTSEEGCGYFVGPYRTEKEAIKVWNEPYRGEE